MFKQANELGPVWLLLNTDEWLQKKKGYNFLSYKEREIILTSNRFIERVIKAKDNNDTVVNNLREFVKNGFIIVENKIPNIINTPPNVGVPAFLIM